MGPEDGDILSSNHPPLAGNLADLWGRGLVPTSQWQQVGFCSQPSAFPVPPPLTSSPFSRLGRVSPRTPLVLGKGYLQFLYFGLTASL